MKNDHQHSCNCSSDHSCSCEHHDHSQQHQHSKQALYGESTEVPAVFSHSFLLVFEPEISGAEVGAFLEEWIASLQQWVTEHQYFIGHIKVFAENGADFNLWNATTGGKINIKGSPNWQSSRITNCVINITAIVFGAVETALRLITIESLNNKLPQHRKL